GIGPIAVRYAAQIRELLHSQTMKRMAAEEEAARAEAAAERAARIKALMVSRPDGPSVEPRTRITPAPVEAPVKVEPQTAKKAEHADPVKTADPIGPAPVPPA